MSKDAQMYKATQELNETLYLVIHLLGDVIRIFFMGIWQLRIGWKLMLTLGLAATGLVAGAIISEWRLLLTIAPAPVTVLMFGIMRRAEIEDYNKRFDDVGFKGRDGRPPYLISKKDMGKCRTSCYWRSNIPLSEWKNKIPAIQTAMDCTILTVEQGNSQRVVRTVSIPADMRISSMLQWSDEMMRAKSSEIVLGESIAGLVYFDLDSTPHWIFAGSTGSGKSVLMRSVVYQCIVKGHKVYLMDFKRGVEFGKAYDDFCEVIMDKEHAVQLLTGLVQENRRRLDLFRNFGIKNLAEYNAANKDNPLDRVVVFIDELAILLIPTRAKGDKELTAQATDCLENIAILGRAAGINLIFGIQRPDANTVTGQIKSNVSGRVCGYFADPAPSMIVLNNTRANDIDSDAKGRFMFQDGKETIEFQGYYKTEKQVIEGIITARTQKFVQNGTPSGQQDKPTKRKRIMPKLNPELNFSYDEETTHV